jgi:glucose-6-phosphate 1-dehydrogenase
MKFSHLAALSLCSLVALILCGCGAQAQPTGAAKKAFVLLGATGDNALRPAGVWNGLFEAWCAGFVDGVIDIHVQINEGHPEKEIRDSVMAAITPFFETLKADKSWKCMRSEGHCSPSTFFDAAQLNTWAGIGKYNASGQAANMSYLASYQEVISYMSLPPAAFKEWAHAIVKYWGGGSKVHFAFEKPFGGGRDSLNDAISLHEDILDSGLDPDNFHLTDHWLSFFMVKHLPKFQEIVQPKLGLDWSRKGIKKIVVTEYEERGFGGRGAFIDGLGQVRDMVQSHLLQVLALTMVDPNVADLSAAKLAIFKELSLSDKGCELWQFDGLLESKKLQFHESFADSTFCRVNLKSSNSQWQGVELVIQTAKSMDINLYTIEVFEKDGQGVLTYDIGKEEVGIADIKVKNWVLKDNSEFQIPLPGFKQGATEKGKPDVDSTGNGYILRYSDPDLYFPKPYSKIAKALISGDYGAAFVTWPECQRSWEIITDFSPSVCLDPAPEKVEIYLPAFLCDKTAPAMCDQHETVKDKYEKTYSCTPQHNEWYGDLDLYKAKCNISSTTTPKPKAPQILL